MMGKIHIHQFRGRNNEGILFLVICLMLLAICIIAPDQISLALAADIIRSGVVTMALALGLLPIVISGGMDVSFTAIAVFSGYTVIAAMTSWGFDGHIWPFIASALIGAILGLCNALLVARYRIETLVATLGTQVIIRGALLACIGSAYISVLPPLLDSVGTTSAFSLGVSPVNITVLLVIFIALGVAFLLGRTTFGRSIYAIGSDREAARRIGISVPRIQVGVYVLAGFLAGIGGIVHMVISRHASPFELVGTEMNVIAAVVIGGALDSGGRGSVRGTVLGVLLISLTQNSLVRLGVSSYWQSFVVGLIILLGVAIQARSALLAVRRPHILEGADA
ncbi:ABC transporter permease [Schaalia sp. lx-260]|uniref:ABC transporter permease n=1 Tax=Schaalia sp. lx-260 TaxID=2899082 RepID=UPI001E2FCFC8|nr:ABC transporter permease [Schaalia sp. lx-260]MCD4548939.1 ABC transporter permease [Schaalia sp. lx-260]